MTDRQKVVLVEPDAGVGAWWEAALSEEGWDVSVVSDPEVAFQLIRRTRPAAVVMRGRAPRRPVVSPAQAPAILTAHGADSGRHPARSG